MTKQIRDAYGEALVKYGKNDPRIVVLDSDVSSSTKSGIFSSACPERFFNCGIAEANMAAMAGGLAASGKIPFVNTFAVFITSLGLLAARSFGSYSHLPIKMMGAYGGLSDAFDGPSHHSVEDIAIMRALPNFEVYVASDEVQTDWLVKNAIENQNPQYIRLSRDAFPSIYKNDEEFKVGKGKIVREGTDATIIACGLMVGKALEAADQLYKDGVNVRVVDMFCIKPLDIDLVLDCAKKTGVIVTAEEHNIIGGLGSAVSEALCLAEAQVSFDMVGLQDCHAECGPYSALLDKYGLSTQVITHKVKNKITKNN